MKVRVKVCGGDDEFGLGDDGNESLWG